MCTCPVFHIKHPVTTFQTCLTREEHNKVYGEFKFYWNQICFCLQGQALLWYGYEAYIVTPYMNVTFILKHVITGNIKLLTLLP
jgi:hypothetical protein